MNFGTVTAIHPDSYIAKRGITRRGFGGQYHRPDSIKTYSFRGPAHDPTSPTANCASEKPKTSFGDLFTAVLGSKLANQSASSSPPPLPGWQPEAAPVPAPRSVPIPAPTQPCLFTSKDHYAEPTVFEYRHREDRELQLDMRCLRLIQKLVKFAEYRDIVHRFFINDEVAEEKKEEQGRMHSVLGIRVHLLKVLRLKEPRRSVINTSHTALGFEGNDCQTKEENGVTAATYGIETVAEQDGCIDVSYDDEKERVSMNRSLILGVGGSNSPETILRRLARSVSTRLSHKRALLEQAILKLNDIQSNEVPIRHILRKTVDVLPKMKSDSEICFIRLMQQFPSPSSSESPPASPFSFDKEGTVNFRVCRVTSGNQLPMGCRTPIQETATHNLVTRFDRLCSSQSVVMKLLCQLARRYYIVDRKLAALNADQECSQSDDCPGEREAEFFSLRSQKQQLEGQIIEAQRLREDLENTKSRFLSGLQYQFYVVTMSGNSVSPTTQSGPMNENGDCSPNDLSPIDQNNEMKIESTISLAEFISKHLDERGQALLIKLILETEIFDDQEIVDCIGDHLRVVSSFST